MGQTKIKNEEHTVIYLILLFIIIYFFLTIRRSREHFIKVNGNIHWIFLYIYIYIYIYIYMVSKTDLTSYADDNTTFVTANNIDDVITVIKNVRKTKIENSN